MSIPSTGAPPLPFLIKTQGQPFGNLVLPSAGLLVKTTTLIITTQTTTTYLGTFVTGPTTASIRVRIVGGGGGGGGAAGGSSTYSAGSGGGGGGYTEKLISVTPNTGYAYVIGAGGTGGSPTAGTGYFSSFTANGTTYTAYGGSAGSVITATSTTTTTAGGGGGTVGLNGDLDAAGSNGDAAIVSGVGPYCVGGNGGASYFCGGGLGAVGATGASGATATGFGGGGGGGISVNVSPFTGGIGGHGCIVVDEYAGGQTQQTNGLAFLGVQIFNYNDGQSTYTPRPGCNAVLVEMVGGGGGGGGAQGGTGSDVACGAGGGSGVYLKLWISGPIAGGAVSVGAGGTGGIGASPGTDAGSGGTTSIYINGLQYIAPPGTGGECAGASTTIQVSAPGGQGTGVTTANVLAMSASTALPGFYNETSSLGFSGYGGANPLGCSGQAVGYSAGTSNPGTGYGAGGGGAGTYSALGNVNGGAGAAGAVIVYEFA